MTRMYSRPRDVTLRASWSASLSVEWGSTVDPTAITPLFLVTSTDVTDPPSSGWVAGEWAGLYASGWTQAYTPTIGSSATSFEIVAGTTYKLWMRVPDLGDEDEPLECGLIWCR